MSTAASSRPFQIAPGTLRSVRNRLYLSGLTGVLAFMLMMRRLIEQSANCVRMPARMAGMPSFVCSRPVTRPASRPATTAASSAAHAGQPAMMSMTVTAPPVVNDPSTVRSATSSRRNVMYTPRAMMPQMMPWATPPGRRETRFGRLRDARTSEFISLPHSVEYPCRRNCGREPGIVLKISRWPRSRSGW